MAGQGRDFLPKKRKDLQVIANRIDWRIEAVGKPAVLQIFPGHSYFVTEVGRPKLPPLHLTGHKGVNNLMYIPAGSVLDSRYMKVSPKNWLTQFLDDPDAMDRWGIITRNSVPYVRIYEVINGIGYAERKSDHFLNGYALELDELEQTALEIDRALTGPTFLMDDKSKRNLLIAQRQIEQRRSDIHSIVANRVVRDISLHFAKNRARSRLFMMASTIERWAEEIKDHSVRIAAVQEMTNPILAELPFFNSKEIRDLVNRAKIALSYFGERPSKKDDLDIFSKPRLGFSLEQVANVLFAAAEKLQTESEAAPAIEKANAARLVRGDI